MIEPGSLLVAHPNTQGKIFTRSVILITEHHVGGTVGLVLNKHSSFGLDSVMASHHIDYSGSDPVYLGGPTNSRALCVLHEEPRSGNVMSVGPWWISSDRAMLHELGQGLIAGPWRVIAGVSSWAQSQLAAEIEQNLWLQCSAHTDLVFGSTGLHQWNRCVEHCASERVREYF